LSDEEQKRLTQGRTTDPEAYRLYREAIYHINKFRREETEAAIKCSREALAKDREFPLAYAALGRSYVLLGNLYDGPNKSHPEAKKYLTRALDLDRNLPEVHSGLAAIAMFHDWDWPAAERELKQAIALNPNEMLTWNLHGFWLAAQGKDRLSEALASIQRGQALDPLAAARWHELAMCHNWMQRYDEAIADAQKAIDLDRDFPLVYDKLGLALVQKGLGEKAIGTLTEALARGHRHPRVQGMLGYAYAVAGRKEETQKVLAELKSRAAKQFGCALPIASIYAALGEKDAAFGWLQIAANERDSAVIWVKVDPTLENLRTDPRFARLLEQMRLPP
jgi:tetratricopeptide (TPR) repeat protein